MDYATFCEAIYTDLEKTLDKEFTEASTAVKMTLMQEEFVNILDRWMNGDY